MFNKCPKCHVKLGLPIYHGFCSLNCRIVNYIQLQMQHKVSHCLVCNTELKRQQVRYCSYKCYRNFAKIRYQLAHSTRFEGDINIKYQIKKCVQCNKHFGTEKQIDICDTCQIDSNKSLLCIDLSQYC